MKRTPEIATISGINERNSVTRNLVNVLNPTRKKGNVQNGKLIKANVIATTNNDLSLGKYFEA